MQPAVLIRLRPAGPWRSGPGDDGNGNVDPLFGSDRLFSAISIAMKQLGHLEEWLDTTARVTAAPALAFTSLFPFQGDTLFAPPPATVWPPPPSLVVAPSPVFLSKLRWSAARYVPVALIESILLGQNVLADQWLPDPQTQCLLRRDRPSSSPFRIVTRKICAVDRLTAGVSLRGTACIEFEPNSGLWGVARFADAAAQERWQDRLQAAFRLAADSGFGGRRSSGWGQVRALEFQSGVWPGVILPKLARRLDGSETGEGPGYWLLSLFSPGASDNVDWTRGDYSLKVRGGFVHTTGQTKKLLRMVVEGSVLSASAEPAGAAVDVAPEGVVHPVYRAGFAVSLRLPVIEIAPQEAGPVELPSDLEALEPAPCDEERPLPEPTPSTEEEFSVEAMPVAGEPEEGSALLLPTEPDPESRPEEAKLEEPESAELNSEPSTPRHEAMLDEPRLEEPDPEVASPEEVEPKDEI